MRRDLLEILACPEDKAPLTVQVLEETDAGIVAGSLACTACGFVYPIEEGVPNLLPPSLHVDEVRERAD